MKLARVKLSYMGRSFTIHCHRQRPALKHLSSPRDPRVSDETPGSFKISVPIQPVAARLSDEMSKGFTRVRRRTPRCASDNNMAPGVPLECAVGSSEDFVLYDGNVKFA
jgi:hypothetical protein